jgi:hypothetical protein
VVTVIGERIGADAELRGHASPLLDSIRECEHAGGLWTTARTVRVFYISAESWSDAITAAVRG